MRWRVAVLLWVCACCGCESAPEPTETIVMVDADKAVRELTTHMHVQVESVSGDHRHSEGALDPRGLWPVRLAVLPHEGDATREFRLSVEAQSQDGTTLVRARVRAGFVQDRKRFVHVRLTAECLNRDEECDEDSTCLAGDCVSARVSRSALCASREARDCQGPAAGRSQPAAGSGEAATGSGQAAAPGPCGEGELLCAGQCVARDSVEHCGACGHDCSKLPNMRVPARCAADRCVFDPADCASGHGDCNGDPEDGCETELNDAAHCGSCGVACAPDTELCAAKPEGQACVPHCPADKPVLCNDTCVDTNTSAEHCGKCATACQSGMRCEAGQCRPICAPDRVACGDACVDVEHDDQHCGGCGVACGKDRMCQARTCVVRCVQGAACEPSACRRGSTQCAGGPMCKEEGPASDGTSCGDGVSCAGGFCTCGMSNGSTKPFYGCSLETDCQPGHVCIDLGGNAHYFCKPLCSTDADCVPFPGLRCSSALCRDGSKPGVGVCVQIDSELSPAYGATACCRGAGPSTRSVSGCADGTREAFTDLAQFPAIAGCEAAWPLASTRAPPTGRGCGNSIGVECSVPADACGVGWHVCGAPPYGPEDISYKVTADQCASQPGKYAAALGDQGCTVCEDQAVGAGAVCCGTSCLQGNASCVFPQATAWFGSVNNRWGYCGGLVAAQPNQGVLCCRGSA